MLERGYAKMARKKKGIWLSTSSPEIHEEVWRTYEGKLQRPPETILRNVKINEKEERI